MTEQQDNLRIKMVALLYGELPAEEVHEVRRAIDADPELSMEFARWQSLTKTIRENTHEFDPAPRVRASILTAARASIAKNGEAESDGKAKGSSWLSWIERLGAAPAFAGFGLVVLAAGLLYTVTQNYSDEGLSTVAEVPTETERFEKGKATPESLQKLSAPKVQAEPSEETEAEAEEVFEDQVGSLFAQEDGFDSKMNPGVISGSGSGGLGSRGIGAGGGGRSQGLGGMAIKTKKRSGPIAKGDSGSTSVKGRPATRAKKAAKAKLKPQMAARSRRARAPSPKRKEAREAYDYEDLAIEETGAVPPVEISKQSAPAPLPEPAAAPPAPARRVDSLLDGIEPAAAPPRAAEAAEPRDNNQDSEAAASDDGVAHKPVAIGPPESEVRGRGLSSGGAGRAQARPVPPTVRIRVSSLEVDEVCQTGPARSWIDLLQKRLMRCVKPQTAVGTVSAAWEILPTGQIRVISAEAGTPRLEPFAGCIRRMLVRQRVGGERNKSCSVSMRIETLAP